MFRIRFILILLHIQILPIIEKKLRTFLYTVIFWLAKDIENINSNENNSELDFLCSSYLQKKNNKIFVMCNFFNDFWLVFDKAGSGSV